VNNDFSACSSVKDDAARLSCFDASMEKRKKDRPQISTPATPKEGKYYPDGHGGKVYFPLGDLSFADDVVLFKKGRPAASNPKDSIPTKALGAPDYDKNRDDGFVIR